MKWEMEDEETRDRQRSFRVTTFLRYDTTGVGNQSSAMHCAYNFLAIREAGFNQFSPYALSQKDISSSRILSPLSLDICPDSPVPR
jgi:hypothetical protein